MTRLQFLMLAGSISMTGVMVGCDDHIAQTAKARAALDEAIVLIDEAEQGFVSGDASAEYRAFRLTRLDEAAGKLQSVISQGGDPVAKSGAHRLLASVKSSQARDTSDQADTGFSLINRRSTGLFNQLGTAQRIDALIVSRTGDGGAILEALKQGQDLIKQSKAAVNASLAELSVQREAAILNAEKFNSQAASHLTRAGEFEEQSRVAPNREVKQDVYNKAYSAQIDAQAAKRLAEEQEIQAGLAEQQIEGLRSDLALWDKTAAQLAELQQRVETEGADAARDVSTAGSERGLALSRVQERVDVLTKMFDESVQAPLTAAAADMGDAVQQLQQAIGSAGSQDRAYRRNLNLEQVGMKVELAGVLSRHAGYADDFSQLLASVAQHPVVANGPAASGFRATQTQFAEQAATLKQQAEEVIADGLEQSESLTGDDDIGQASQSLAQALRSYGQQLN